MELNITFCSLFSEHVIPPLVSDRLERVYIAPRGHVLVADRPKKWMPDGRGVGRTRETEQMITNDSTPPPPPPPGPR